LFTPGLIEIVVEPPKQSRSGRDLDEAVQAEPDSDTEPAVTRQ